MRLLWRSAMLRVLTLSTLFPNASQPTLGVFVERQTLALAGLDDVALEVVSPIGLPPWPLSLHSHYAPHPLLPLREEWNGVTLHRPPFRALPHIPAARAARPLANSPDDRRVGNKRVR